ncbi:MAG: 4Fe-4S dicluster domain-containing protein [Verrucomicrobiia bacterium]
MDKLPLHIIRRPELDRVFGLLRDNGYTLIGPTRRDGVIQYSEIRSLPDLPIGYSDRQAPGSYELVKSETPRCFGFVHGADSWKRFLFPPKRRVFGASRRAGPKTPFDIDDLRSPPPAYAFVGVRACEIAAIGILDKVIGSELLDPFYRQARDKMFVLAVNCIEPGGTCFCVSMNTGPRVTRSFDLCLTELGEEFGVEVGSERGAALFKQLTSRPATAAEKELFRLLIERASERMGRHLETEGLPELLRKSIESPRWQTIASRCLACGNCTMVCPTCFCYNVVDSTDLKCRKAERWRYWDSCFTLEFSYLGATSVRYEISSRYRQWMTHKLAWWHDQFGTSGCVGCGRCVTWCPVGIDITAEAAGFRETAPPRAVPLTPQQQAMPS